MPRALLRTTLLVAAIVAAFTASSRVQAPLPAIDFADEIARLSEAEGSFDTDNLISNENGYLGVIPQLLQRRVSGGTYLGVGPDQNFSYIARIRPDLAYIVDIRRDNLLLHLLFKALFARSSSRIEYLCALTGRAPPETPHDWNEAPIGRLAAHVDGQPVDREHLRNLRDELVRTIRTFRVPLSTTDVETIYRFHQAFVADGLDLRFHSFGRMPHPNYPTFRELLLATDGEGVAWNYLAREDDFQFVKALQSRHRVIPVVGNVAGLHAMQAIADAVAARDSHVSAFYISNVETYLYGDEVSRFEENVRRLRRSPRSVFIRSFFGRGGPSVSAVSPLGEPLR